MIKARSDLSRSYQVIRTEFADRLEVENGLANFLNPKVNVESGVELPAIYDPKDGKTLKDELAQEGGPYYGAKVTWLVYTESPPKKASENAGEDEEE